MFGCYSKLLSDLYLSSRTLNLLSSMGAAGDSSCSTCFAEVKNLTRFSPFISVFDLREMTDARE